jgi:formylglycine-generating enzyme required for sulfatase activity
MLFLLQTLFIVLTTFLLTKATSAEVKFHNKPASQKKAGKIYYKQTVAPKIVDIPGGCFVMGSQEHETDRQSNETAHRVCVKRFHMAIQEVTIAEFKTFVEETDYISDAEINFLARGCWSFDPQQTEHWNWQGRANWRTPLDAPSTDNQPVGCVSFYDATQYIKWLNKKTGQHYRLPTEAEWEYAARAGTTSAYFWGNNPDLACRYANAADQTTYKDWAWPISNQCYDRFFFNAPVKSFLANGFGLFDMLGNVWEWTCSRYEPDYNGQEQVCMADGEINNAFVAVRGGGWNADPARLRSAYRNWESPWIRMATWGFRLVKDSNYRRN